MLHIFNVNCGSLLTFDVNLAMKRVSELKNAIRESHGISCEKQVMLASDGQELIDAERACSYAAGTETNPIYLFNKLSIEKESLQSTQIFREVTDFSGSIQKALLLPPCYETVDYRTKLAKTLLDATKYNVQQMKELVHDEHLMFQGWQAAMANLRGEVDLFLKRLDYISTRCKTILQQFERDGNVLEGIDEALQVLHKIPVLPALLKSVLSCSISSNDRHKVSLLHWIETQCKNVSLRKMAEDCKKKEHYLSQEHFKTLLDECKKAETQAGDKRLKEISGLNERLFALDQRVMAAEQRVVEQTGITNGFLKNRERARELCHGSSSMDALLTLCESHVKQLQIMSEHETATREALNTCVHAKNELAENLHARLRWLYIVQRSLLNADVKLTMFYRQLSVLETQKEFLAQVKHCPTLYLSALTEVVRRKQFADIYLQWANKAVADARAERDREIVKRKTFESNISGHFIQKLFQGFSDKPPSLSRKPLSAFDSDLPNITQDQLDTLSQLLPNYRDILQASTSDSNATSMTLTHSSIVSPESSSNNVQCYSQGVDSGIGSTSEKLTAMKASATGSFTVFYRPVSSLAHASSSLMENVKHVSVDEQSTQTEISHINENEPGGFVVTNMERPSLVDVEDQGTQTNEISVKNGATTELTQRGQSVTPTHEQGSSASSPNISEAGFSQINDIISPDSPPDSEFFSIVPHSFGSNTPHSISSHNDSPREFSRKFDASPQRSDAIKVGSMDSNSSISYQKVDGLSSDDEMFHSFASDPQDVKILRKKLLQVQGEYDKLVEESRHAKEDLEILVKKLESELQLQRESQHAIESDFEKRWEESKQELDNVIKQLENERLERKKAWTEGANLEKKLKHTEEEFALTKVLLESIKSEINTKNGILDKLKSEIDDVQQAYMSLSEENQHKIKELIEEKNNEIEAFKTIIVKKEKEITLAHTELSTADDRIQELEEMLSDRDHKEQEDATQFAAYEAKITELSSRLNVAFESQQKSCHETKEVRSQMAENEASLQKANKEITSLTLLLADYEVQLSDQRSKQEQIRSMKVNQSKLENEKSDLETEILTLKSQLNLLKEELHESKREAQSVRSIAMQDSKTHDEQIEKLASAHSKEKEAMLKNQEDALLKLHEKHETEIQKLIKRHENVIMDKNEEMKTIKAEIAGMYRDEIDELQADRLAALATAQQDIEDTREKLRESKRQHEKTKCNAFESEEKLSQEIKSLKEECSRLTQVNQELSEAESVLKRQLTDAQEEIKKFSENEKCEAANTLESALSSSTDDVTEAKRSKMDSSFSEEMSSSTLEMIDDVVDSDGKLSLENHNHVIQTLRRKFNDDKVKLENMYRKREEEAARRRQMVFNSAIQRVSSSKDVEIKNLRDQLMTQSQMEANGLSGSIMTLAPQDMAASMNSPSQFSNLPSDALLSQSSLESSSSSSGIPTRGKDKAAINNFQSGDTVLICFNDTYQNFSLITSSRYVHFVHHESLKNLGLDIDDPRSKSSMTLGIFKVKEFCQARKAQNRFRVPINTKFYRVVVEPPPKK